MGCGHSKNKDPYSVILQKYGVDMVKDFTICMAQVQFIESNAKQIVKIVQEKTETIKNTLLGRLQLLKMTIDKSYQKSISRIQKSNPKAVSAVQKVFNTKIQQLMGYKDVIKKVNDFKQEAKLSIQREQSHTMSYLTNFIKQYEQELRQKIPELKKFQMLEDDQQQSFIKTAKQRHKASIQKGLTQVQNMLAQKCNFNNFEPKYESIVTKEKLDQLLHFAQRSFMGGEQKIKGATDCHTC